MKLNSSRPSLSLLAVLLIGSSLISSSAFADRECEQHSCDRGFGGAGYGSATFQVSSSDPTDPWGFGGAGTIAQAQAEAQAITNCEAIVADRYAAAYNYCSKKRDECLNETSASCAASNIGAGCSSPCDISYCEMSASGDTVTITCIAQGYGSVVMVCGGADDPENPLPTIPNDPFHGPYSSNSNQLLNDDDDQPAPGGPGVPTHFRNDHMPTDRNY